MAVPANSTNERRGELDRRVEQLETQLTYSDDLVQQLNDTVAAQQRQIEALVASIELLHERLTEALASTPTANNSADERPPHY